LENSADKYYKDNYSVMVFRFCCQLILIDLCMITD
jgi:hypothetical protein